MAEDAFTRDLMAWQNQVVADRDLTLLAFHVAFVIGQHINRESRKAWPSQTRIGVILGVTERAVRTAVKQLQDQGHLSVCVRHGRGDSNQYQMILKNRNIASGLDTEKRNDASALGPENRNDGSSFEAEKGNGGSGIEAENRNRGSMKPEPPFLLTI